MLPTSGMSCSVGAVFRRSARRKVLSTDMAAICCCASTRKVSASCCACALVWPVTRPCGPLKSSTPCRGMRPKAATYGGRPADQQEFLACAAAAVVSSIWSLPTTACCSITRSMSDLYVALRRSIGLSCCVLLPEHSPCRHRLHP